MAEEAQKGGSGCGCIVFIVLLIFIIINVNKRDHLNNQVEKRFDCYIDEVLLIDPNIEISGFIAIRESNITYEIFETYNEETDLYARYDFLRSVDKFTCYRVDGKTYSQQLVDNDAHVYHLWIWIPAGLLIADLVILVCICACFCCVAIANH